MDRFVAAMDRACADLAEQTQAIRAELTRLGTGTLTLAPFVEIERWTRGQVPRLRARNATIRERVPGWDPGIVTYDEATMPYATPQESRREGAAMGVLYRQHVLAAKLGMTSPRPNDAVPRFRELLLRILAHKDDPDFAAAFFGELGTGGTMALPKDLLSLFGPAAAGIPMRVEEKRILGGFSRMFAAASIAVPGDSRFSKVMGDVERGGGSVDAGALSWLVSAGGFPTQWLTVVARRHLGGGGGRADVAGRFLSALSRDAVAARAVVEDLAGLSVLVAGDLEASDAFGRVLAAASGVYDEVDGAHGVEAAGFAFRVITEGPGLVRNEVVRRYFAEIAGAYATEFAASAAFLDPDSQHPSRLGGFDDKLVGTTPMFRLSLADSYQFMKTFADTDAHMEPFNRGMASLTQRLFEAGVRADRHLLAFPPPDRLQRQTAIEQVFARLGTVAGMQFAAMKAVRGTADLRDREEVDRFGQALDKGMDTGMLFLPAAGGLPAAAGWMVLSWGLKDGVAAAMEPELRMPDVNRQELDQARATLYEIAAGLIAHGYTSQDAPVVFKRPTDPLIVDEEGRLRPHVQINGNPRAMRAFLLWLKENGSVDDQADRRTLGKVAATASTRFSGDRENVENFLATVDPDLKKVLIGEG
ncbi:hypothetical protein [Nonomuraea gerenzanensis]|uniref:Uncharacterized protein n=1 Tax=Nonomuraea gerenzanensis TaxID=93944 RepID=A0A1M4EB51_9ACTN|nr:hypothetical protein [Nonomuraea gerenzanensis]UBU18209.1 hypothetical protein LCN96_25245 [Nonomuraea gerenzanensis]SBO96024.1 hypothetical protein BN4615_P5540 [Nonomuraea gerenzanensis]